MFRSLGANLVTAVALKVIEGNFRLPDSIVLAYPPLRLQYIPSPSRILSLMDPLLPVGVLKTCIAAYTGDVLKSPNKKLNSSFYGDETFNPYDLDIGDTLDECSMNYRRAFSENDILKLRGQYPSQNEFDENERFYSDFPYSDSSSTSEDDFSLIDNFSLSGSTNECEPPSMLRSFTSSFSSKVQLMTYNMTTYLYGKDKVEGEYQAAELVEKSRSDCLTNSVKVSKSKNKSYEFQSSLKNDVFANPKKQNNTQSFKDNSVSFQNPTTGFSICKECLHRSETCICQRLIPKVRPKKAADKYRASYHYRDRSLSACCDQNENSNINLRSHSTSSLLDKNNFREADNEDASIQNQDSCGLEMRPCGDSNNDSCSNSATFKSSVVSPISNLQPPQIKSTNDSFELGRNPYLSPFMASDDLLIKLPSVIIVVRIFITVV